MTYAKPQIHPLDARLDAAMCKPSSTPCYSYVKVGRASLCFPGRTGVSTDFDLGVLEQILPTAVPTLNPGGALLP